MNGILISGDFKPINVYKKTLDLSKPQNFVTVYQNFSSSIFKKKLKNTDFLWELDIVHKIFFKNRLKTFLMNKINTLK